MQGIERKSCLVGGTSINQNTELFLIVPFQWKTTQKWQFHTHTHHTHHTHTHTHTHTLSLDYCIWKAHRTTTSQQAQMQCRKDAISATLVVKRRAVKIRAKAEGAAVNQKRNLAGKLGQIVLRRCVFRVCVYVYAHVGERTGQDETETWTSCRERERS